MGITGSTVQDYAGRDFNVIEGDRGKMGEVVLNTFKEIKGLIEGRARERTRATLPLRGGGGMNKGTYASDGGFP